MERSAEGKGSQINSNSLQSIVGAGLPAIAIFQSPYWLADISLSPASQLPHLNRIQSFLLGKRRRSRVIGSSSLTIKEGTGSLPGVCPKRKNRAIRRLSASLAFTGKLS